MNDSNKITSIHTKNSVYQILECGPCKFQITKIQSINLRSNYFYEGQVFWVDSWQAAVGKPAQLGTVRTSVVTKID